MIDADGNAVDSKRSKTMSTDEMMDDMKITFDEVAPPDPDAMRRAMQSDGDGSNKLGPTHFKRCLAMMFVLRGVLNFYTVFISFRNAMEPQTQGAPNSGGDFEGNYIISKRLVAFMETLYVGYKLFIVIYGIVYLNCAIRDKVKYKMAGKQSRANTRHFDRTEDAYVYTNSLTDAASFSMIKFLPSLAKLPRLISWAKLEGKSWVALFIENGSMRYRTSPLRFFCTCLVSGP